MSYFQKRGKITNALPENLEDKAPFPRNALVELTNGCNHACVFCRNSNQQRRATRLPLEKFKNFIRQATALGLEEVGLYSTGEPFMTKNLADYIRAAKSSGIQRVYITTNGALASLDKVIACHTAGLDSIKFSINASNPEDYRVVHGSDDFEKVVETVKAVYDWKTNTGTELQMLASCVIVPSIGDIRAQHRALFGRYFEDIAYVAAWSQGGQAFSLVGELEVSAHGVFANLGKENPPEDVKPCAMVWNRYHLTAEGYLTTCCVDYELDLVFSDLDRESLKTAWNNTLVRRVRAAHVSGKLDGLLCNQCLHNRPAPYAPLSTVQKSTKSTALIERERRKLKVRIEQADARARP